MRDCRGSVFPFNRGGNASAKRIGKQLHAVANAQNRFWAFAQEARQLWRSRVVNATWSAGKDVAGGEMLIGMLGAAIVGEDFGVDTEFADAPRDELCVLGSEINDGDAALFQILHGFCLAVIEIGLCRMA